MPRGLKFHFCAAAIVALSAIGLLASADAPLAQTVPAPQAPAAAPAAPPKTLLPGMKSANDFLLMRLSRNMALRGYLEIMHREFRNADMDTDGEISEADAVLGAQLARAAVRAIFIGDLMRADLDGDGVVTEDELRTMLRHERYAHNPQVPAGSTPEAQTEAQVRHIMAADANHDGRITFDEARNYIDSEPSNAWGQMAGGAVRQLLLFVPEGKSVLTLPDFDAILEKFFGEVDTNGDGTISDDELKAYRDSHREPPPRPQPPVPPPGPATASRQPSDKAYAPRGTMGVTCPMPKPSDAAKIVLIGTSETMALSTVAIGSQDVTVGVGNIMVEPGTEPIYLVVTSYQPAIWRLYGAVERIERLVLTETAGPVVKNVPEGTPLVGATGIAADRVTFLDKIVCLKEFTAVPSAAASTAAVTVKVDTGRDVAVVAGITDLSDASVPSGAVHGASGRLVVFSNGGLTIHGGNANILVIGDITDTNVSRFYPGGIIDIDPHRVVASMPVARYDVLPGRAGLAQLVKEGKIEAKDGEFRIKAKIHFPAELDGMHATKFRLLRGVPMPDGDPGSSPVISDETGQPIKFDAAAH